MQIAFVTETWPPELNGVALSVRRTVAWLRDRGHAVQLVRPRQPAETARLDDEEMRVPGVPLPMYRDLRMGMPVAATLVKRWRAARPAVVHVATEGPLGWAAIRAARRLGIPVTSDFRTRFDDYTKHYGLGFAAPVVRAYLRRLHNRTATTFVPTEQLRETLWQTGFERIEVVSRGVDTTAFSPAHRDPALRAAWGADADAPVFLYVGRVAAEKNVPLAIESWRAARILAPDARMVIVGDGPLRAKLERDHPDVVFAGVQRDGGLARHYASADVFLFPSLTETFGNVTIEAMAAGLAIVAFRHAAAAAHVVHGSSGLLARPGADDAFVRGAVFLATHPHWRRRFAALARETACSLAWDGVLARFETHLEAAVRDARRTRDNDDDARPRPAP